MWIFWGDGMLSIILHTYQEQNKKFNSNANANFKLVLAQINTLQQSRPGMPVQEWFAPRHPPRCRCGVPNSLELEAVTHPGVKIWSSLIKLLLIGC